MPAYLTTPDADESSGLCVPDTTIRKHFQYTHSFLIPIDRNWDTWLTSPVILLKKSKNLAFISISAAEASLVGSGCE